MKRTKTGFTLVELLVVIAIIGILIGMLMPAVQRVRESARRTDCLNRMRQIGIATTLFHDSNEAFPPARLFAAQNAVAPFDGGNDEPSWLVRILPYLEQNNFYQEWDLSTSFTSHPDDVVSQALPAYICPTRRSIGNANSDPGTRNVNVTSSCGCGGWVQVDVVGGATGDYAGNHGDLSPGSIGAATDYYFGGNGTGVLISSRAKTNSIGKFDWIDRINFSSIKDGASNTILAGELHVTAANLNTLPFNGPIYNGEDLAAFARIGGPGVPILPPNQEPPGVFGFGSWHPGTCNFSLADGSTHVLSNNLDTVTLGQMCNRADGEAQTSR